MNKLNTLLRGVYTLSLYLILVQAAQAQSVLPQGSVLNFVKATVNQQSNAGFAVTNPTSNYADITFTFYGLDGNPVSTVSANPVRQRVAPKGQLSMYANDLFAASPVDGWVQVTSPTPGLFGSYVLGDFAKTLEGAEPGAALSTQVIPLIRQDGTNDSQVVILNPSNVNSSVNVVFYNSAGQVLGQQTPFNLAPHAEVRIRPSSVVLNLPADNFSAFISSSVPVVATTIISRNDSSLFAPGQSVDTAAAVRVAPHYLSGNGLDPVLVLANPNSSPVTVRVTLYGQTGGAVDPSLPGPSQASFTIPANGSIAKTTADILGRSFAIPLSINGWLRIDSPNVILNGLLVLDQGTALTAVPLQANPQSRMLYSSVVENQSISTALSLVNPAAAPATADVFLVQTDGTTVAQSSITVPAFSKSLTAAHDVFPDIANQQGSYIFLRSSVALYTTAVVNAPSAIADVPFAVPPVSFGPDIAGTIPRIQVDRTDVHPGDSIRVTVSAGRADDAVFTINNQVLDQTPVTAIAGIFTVTLPALETGYVNLRVHANGADSPAVPLHVLPPDNSPTQSISGTALYQKIDVTDAGLDLNHPVMFPIRNARVEVFDSISQSLLSVSETDVRGRFTIAVPLTGNITVQVLSKIRSFDLRVADNTSQNALYAIVGTFDATAPPSSGLLLLDKTRRSGAFNILEMVQRANDTVKLADASLQPLPVTVFWSTRNTNKVGNPAQGFIGTSEFNISTNTAYILGDRNTDSDEFDDAVIAHEYAHMLASKYSRDDSPGGAHGMGDMLDPRVSWSEGWANFFSSVVRNDPFWRDSMGPNGTQLLRYDLGDSTAAGDPRPGYWSEASVDTLLWGLYAGLDSDGVSYPFSNIWNAFTDLRNDRFVYLPYFLDHFINRVSSATGDVLLMALSRSINYQPNGVPSVTNPFPAPIAVGTSAGPASVDSLTTRRMNLITSSHFYTFTTTGGATTIRMDITGLGAGNNPNANDLDIFLYNIDGRLVDKSDTGGNGQPERMADRLGAGTYIVEVRSYYTNGETGTLVFNSGDYKLSVSVQ